MSKHEDYLVSDIIKRIKEVSADATEKDNNINYDENSYNNSLTRSGLDPVIGERYKQHDEEYIAAALADSTERSHRKFEEDENLQEVNVGVYLGKGERIRAVISRQYNDNNGDSIYNHVLAEHQRDNKHLEGVQRLASSFAKMYVE